MKFFQIAATYGRKIWAAIRRFGKFLYSKRNSIGEIAKSVGAVATSITSTIMASKAVSGLISLLKGKKNKKDSKTNPKGARMGANGKVKSNKTSKSKSGKNKAQTVDEEFNKELRDNRTFYQSCTAEEKRDLKKAEKASSDIKTPEDINSTMFGTYHLWNRNKSVAYNELMEVEQYFKSISSFSGDRDRIEAAEEALNQFRVKYHELYPNSKTDYAEAPSPKTVEAATSEAEKFAQMAKDVRQVFDELTETIYTNDGVDSSYEDETVNPISGDLVRHDERVQPPQDGGSPYEEFNIRHAGGHISETGKRLPEMYLIGNLIETTTLPTYYLRDPDPEKKKLGNITAPDFVPILNWKPGIPHTPACPEEIEHHYDWSEFEGFRQNPEIGSMEDAFLGKGVVWCNENLQCAKVFNDLYLQHPCIYPGNPGYEDFQVRFRNAYWDLCRVVPGLGDCGRVLAHPFAGGPDDADASIEALRERGDYNQIYGLNNPPSMEKVFFEILRFGSICFLEKMDALEKEHPEVKFNIKSPVQVADLYYQGVLLMVDQGKMELPDYVVDSILVELEAYGIHLNYADGEESEYETLPIGQQIDDGFACSVEELDD